MKHRCGATGKHCDKGYQRERNRIHAKNNPLLANSIAVSFPVQFDGFPALNGQEVTMHFVVDARGNIKEAYEDKQYASQLSDYLMK